MNKKHKKLLYFIVTLSFIIVITILGFHSKRFKTFCKSIPVIGKVADNLVDSYRLRNWPKYEVKVEEIIGSKITDDPLSKFQWNLRMMLDGMSYEEVNGDRARNVVVAVIDKGFGSRNHPDLINKWYKNKTEVLDKKDNDHNGYVDDITGFDFVDRDNDPFLEYDGRSPNSSNSHGQASASIIAAEANNGIGIAGVFNKAYILPLRVDLVHMAEAIQYAIGIGANVIQISGGGGKFCIPLLERIP